MRDTAPRRRVAVFTGNRAEYGLLHPVLVAMGERGDLDVRLIVSGAHVAPGWGATIEEIRSDGMPIAATVDLGVSGGGVLDDAYVLARGIEGFSRVLDELRPALALVYADRTEGFAAAVAAFKLNVPLAHVEGGDVTEGGTHDDSIRHAMTKLAHLHFTTSREAAERVLRLGEESWRVTFAGLPTLDSIARKDYLAPDEICRELALDPGRPIVVFTYHPIALVPEEGAREARECLEALGAVGAQTVVTYPNSDPGSQGIVECYAGFRGTPGFQFHASLGRRRMLGLYGVASAVVGNSSSGIKETPSFGLPCVNVGARQTGRLRAGNVLDVPAERAAVEAAVRCVLFDPAMREQARRATNPYGDGRAGEIIAARLAEVALDARLLRKGITY